MNDLERELAAKAILMDLVNEAQDTADVAHISEVLWDHVDEHEEDDVYAIRRLIAGATIYAEVEL